MYIYTCAIFFHAIVNLTLITWTTLPFRLLNKYGPCIEKILKRCLYSFCIVPQQIFDS